jgi:D-alanyl-lipoteichoic acid acyltransferase DltB (MBOAT superfamily)
MLYQTLEFGIFYLVVFALYWWAGRERLGLQNLLLLAASYFFYGWWDWRFLGLLLATSTSDFLIARQLATASDERQRRRWLFLSVGIDLGILGLFKYLGFFIDSFRALMLGFGYEIPPRTLQIILPVGISFYLFQSLSYVIDVYRRRLKPVSDYAVFLTFVSFFPQLVAGPIERAANLLPQFLRPRQFRPEEAVQALRQILWGLFKKVVIADNLGAAAGQIIPFPEAWRASVLAAGVFLFAIQLYCDFSAYSDIASGVARLLGFELTRNFSFPYLARDIPDFWRRWHISLTTWFRDYVFLPLSGGKPAESRLLLIRSYLITFTVSGLWHGANWTFVIWGLLQGLYHIPYILFPRLRSDIRQTRPPFTAAGTLRAAVQTLSTLGLNLFSLVFFMSPSLDHALAYLCEMATPNLFSPLNYFGAEVAGALGFLGFEWLLMHRKETYPFQRAGLPQPLRWAAYLALSCLILYYNYDRKAFIYFQF